MVALVMAVPSTVWWRRMATDFHINPRILITKRLCFIDPAPKKPKRTKTGKISKAKRKQNARFETSLFYWGPAKRVSAFDKEFASITTWSTWGRS
jgi:hypothetical protein